MRMRDDIEWKKVMTHKCLEARFNLGLTEYVNEQSEIGIQVQVEGERREAKTNVA